MLKKNLLNGGGGKDKFIRVRGLATLGSTNGGGGLMCTV